MKCFKKKWGGIRYNLNYIHPFKGGGIKFYKLLNLWTIFTWQQKLTKPLHRTHKTPDQDAWLGKNFILRNLRSFSLMHH